VIRPISSSYGSFVRRLSVPKIRGGLGKAMSGRRGWSRIRGLTISVPGPLAVEARAPRDVGRALGARFRRAVLPRLSVASTFPGQTPYETATHPVDRRSSHSERGRPNPRWGSCAFSPHERACGCVQAYDSLGGKVPIHASATGSLCAHAVRACRRPVWLAFRTRRRV
jgi:hypothetical protein